MTDVPAPVLVDLFFEDADVDDLKAAGLKAFVDENGLIAVLGGKGFDLTEQEDGWFLRLINPSEERVDELKGLGWVPAPRIVWM